MNSRRIWTEQEDKSILQLVQRHGHKNWAHIAIQLSRQYGTHQRTGKQCRQRWHNHLNPGIEKKGWTKVEQQLMFKLHKIHGNKWTVIAESLTGRTDNAIKNYFYSTIRRSLRRMGKFVGSKNSTEQMKHIKPSTLSKIFAAGSELLLDDRMPPEQRQLVAYIRDNCETVRDQIIKFTNYKPKRNDLAKEAEKDEFQKVIKKMVHINEVYERIKVDEKRRRKEQLMFQKDGKIVLSDDSLEEEQENSSEIQNQSQQIQKSLLTNKKNTRNRYSSQKTETTFRVLSKSMDQIKIQQPHAQKSQQQNSLWMVPTVIIKPQNSISPQRLEEHMQIKQQVQLPQFFVQLKEDYIPLMQQQSTNNNRYNFNMQSPAYFINTPTHNPFYFFQSPAGTPKSMEQTTALTQAPPLPSSTIDQFQFSIQKQIESNMTRQGRNSSLSFSTIGSPGSAFSFCNFP